MDVAEADESLLASTDSPETKQFGGRNPCQEKFGKKLRKGTRKGPKTAREKSRGRPNSPPRKTREK